MPVTCQQITCRKQVMPRLCARCLIRCAQEIESGALGSRTHHNGRGFYQAIAMNHPDLSSAHKICTGFLCNLLDICGVFDLQLQIIRRYFWFFAFFPYSCAVMISHGKIVTFDRPVVLMSAIPACIGTPLEARLRIGRQHQTCWPPLISISAPLI